MRKLHFLFAAFPVLYLVLIANILPYLRYVASTTYNIIPQAIVSAIFWALIAVYTVLLTRYFIKHTSKKASVIINTVASVSIIVFIIVTMPWAIQYTWNASIILIASAITNTVLAIKSGNE